MSCGLRRIIQIKEAIQYQRVDIWYNSVNISSSCSYSWSTDGVCWTSWTNQATYDRVCNEIEGDFYLRILLSGEFDKVSLNDRFTNCYSVCLDSSTTFLTDFCGETNMFQPYNNLDCALELQQQLSDSVVCMFGIPIYYIQVDPKKESADYTFKEYFLHQATSIKQLKLIIPNGEMPSSNPKLTEFDFDWEVDWETQLSKTQFAQAFGDTAYPKAGDFVWIPMMNRMWEVNSAYDEKNEGLMWRSTTWKLALVKYTDSTNVEMGSFNDLIDGWTMTYAEAFEEQETNEQEREVGSLPISAPKYAATNLYDIFMEDSVRKQYTKQDTSILDKTYNHRSVTVARNIYRFKNENGCVTYQKQICGDEGTIMFIMETPGTLQGELERDVLNFGEIQCKLQYTSDKKFNIIFGGMIQELDPFHSYMVFLKWNRRTFSTELCIYPYVHKQDIPVYLVRPEMYWFDFENPVCEEVGEYNNDFNMRDKMNCQVHFYPASVTNIKYYNKYLSQEEAIKESIKYTTKHENCVINDLARPILGGHGYAVK